MASDLAPQPNHCGRAETSPPPMARNRTATGSRSLADSLNPALRNKYTQYVQSIGPCLFWISTGHEPFECFARSTPACQGTSKNLKNRIRSLRIKYTNDFIHSLLHYRCVLKLKNKVCKHVVKIFNEYGLKKDGYKYTPKQMSSF